MAKLTENQISEIIQKYAIIGTYSGVAKELHVSPATVKKYVLLQRKNQKEEVPPKEKIYIEIPPIESIIKPNDLTPWLRLSEQETKKMEELIK